MQINLEDVRDKEVIEALERARARLGERSGRSTVRRLIKEADAKVEPVASPPIHAQSRSSAAQNPANRCELSDGHAGPCHRPTRAEAAKTRRAKRKGAKS